MANTIISTLRRFEKQLQAGANAQEVAATAQAALTEEINGKGNYGTAPGREDVRYAAAFALIERGGERGYHEGISQAINQLEAQLLSDELR